jgi:hypothetical protein
MFAGSPFQSRTWCYPFRGAIPEKTNIVAKKARDSYPGHKSTIEGGGDTGYLTYNKGQMM